MGLVNPGRPITLRACHALATANDTIFDAVLYESVAAYAGCTRYMLLILPISIGESGGDMLPGLCCSTHLSVV